jgi:hypothetical protein
MLLRTTVSYGLLQLHKPTSSGQYRLIVIRPPAIPLILLCGLLRRLFAFFKKFKAHSLNVKSCQILALLLSDLNFVVSSLGSYGEEYTSGGDMTTGASTIKDHKSNHSLIEERRFAPILFKAVLSKDSVHDSRSARRSL